MKEKFHQLKWEDILVGAGIITCMTVCFISMMLGVDTVAQVPRDKYFYFGTSCALGAVILLRGVDLINMPQIVVCLTWFVIAVQYFRNNSLGYDVIRARQMEFLAIGLMLILLIDIIRTGRKTKLSSENIIFSKIMTVIFAAGLAMYFKFSILYICPILFFFLTPMSRKRWEQLADFFSVSWYLAFFILATRCLILVPYSQGVRGGKYYGTFLTPGPITILYAGGVACTIYWMLRMKNWGKYKKLRYVFLIPAFIYPMIIVYLSAVRTAESSVLGIVILAFVFWPSEEKPTRWKKRGVIALAFLALLVMMSALGLFVLKNVDYSAVKEFPISPIRNKLVLWRDALDRVDGGMRPDTYFEYGTVLSLLDELTSYRVSLPKQALEQSTLFGDGGVIFTEWSGSVNHPHNNYVSWIFSYGWIIGGGMVVGFFASLVMAIKKVLKSNNAYLFTFIWLGFMTFMMMTEIAMWYYPMALLLVLVLYPLMIEFDEDATNPWTKVAEKYKKKKL